MLIFESYQILPRQSGFLILTAVGTEFHSTDSLRTVIRFLNSTCTYRPSEMMLQNLKIAPLFVTIRQKWFSFFNRLKESLILAERLF